MAVRASIVGRTAELSAIELFTRAIADGPAALVLEGAAGIGKTAIWSQAITQADRDGSTVLSCRCTESDAGWAFSGLGDLLDGLSPDLTLGLPDIQQRALAGALLTADEPVSPLGDRIVAAAVLGVLRGLARAGPLLLAIDDVQWLDPDSATVLSFALRRLHEDPVRLLASCRTGSPPDAMDGAGLGLESERLLVGPASIGTLQRIVQLRLGERFSRPTLTRLHQATGGNPMMFLEMSRALQRRGHEPQVDEALPVPADLSALVSERLLGLSESARDLLLITAALSHPTLTLLEAATADPQAYDAALAEALVAGVLELDGERVRFAHPLIGSTAYAEVTLDRRRRLHQRLAMVVPDPEQHARHAALAARSASASVASALDLACGQARARGSLDSAVELAELALTSTPAVDRVDRLRRTVVAAELQFLLGETVRARRLVTAALQDVAPGVDRVPALLLQARIASSEEGDARVAQLCDQALVESGDDALLLARSHAAFAETSPSGPAIDLMHAERAVELLREMGTPPPELFANALTNLALHSCRLGQGLELATLERAVTLEAQATPPPVSDRAGMALGMCLKVVDEFDESRRWLQAMWTCAVDEGDDSAVPNILGHLAILECWVGDYSLALRYAAEGREIAGRIDVRAPMLFSAHVLVLAHLGRIAEARELGESDLASDQAIGFVAALAVHHRSLGVTELFAGNAESANAHFLRALEISRDTLGVGEPAIMRLHVDAVESLVSVRDLTRAQRLTDELAASSDRNGRPWATTMALHCQALISAATGDVALAMQSLERAVLDHERLAMPFELARTRLLFGRVLRRSGHRSAARAQLTEAHTVFARLGTPIQLRQVDSELAAMGGPTPGGPTGSDQTLTPAEQRIATLVAAGQTSREVASALFMSVRTVDSHLGHIYRKLGVRSRTELAIWASNQ